MANIYELSSNWQQLQQLIEDGELDQEILQDTLEGINGEIEEKADGYAKVMKNLQKDIDGLKAEEKRIADKRKVIENSIKSMKQTLGNAMVMTGKTKFKTDLFSFGIQKNAPSLIVDDESLVGEEFVKISTSLDKTAIKNALKAGIEVQGVHFEQSESLRIR